MEEEEIQEEHFCEECGGSFPIEELEGEDDDIGPFVCEECRQGIRDEREYYRELDQWVERNK